MTSDRSASATLGSERRSGIENTIGIATIVAIATTTRRRPCHCGRAPVRTGRSTSTNESAAIANVTATRSANSATPLRPVRSGLSHSSTGQCQRYSP